MQTKLKPWTEALLVLFALGSLMAMVAPAVFRTETLPWNVGRPIPNQPPAEDRRVYNNSGLSIVVPPNWNAKHLEVRIILSPRQSIPSRSSAMIVCQPWPEEPSDWNNRESTKLGGRAAQRKIERRKSTFDDPALTTWRYFLKLEEQWFEVSYSIAAAHDEIPPMAKQYLETMKFEDGQ